jgi:hypothetical protein
MHARIPSAATVWSSGQDQMAVVKRQLLLLLPGIRIFLDVDDLKAIGDLEVYVQQSGCILIFLSRGYFYSINCMREAQETTNQKKPVVLLREDDINKGGITLADSIQECAGKPEVSDYVFTGRTVTVWKRIQEHQIESLRQIATQTLMTTPRFLGPASSSLVLHLPGEVRLQTLRLPAPLTLYVSSANRGARRAAEALSQRVGMEDITITDVRPDSLAGVTMLLYLNESTWEKADDGSESPLAAEVARARSEGIPLVMVHEADEEHDGCEFGLFFQTTCAQLGLESPSLAAFAALRALGGRGAFIMCAPSQRREPPLALVPQATGPHRRRHLQAACRHVVPATPPRDLHLRHGHDFGREGNEHESADVGQSTEKVRRGQTAVAFLEPRRGRRPRQLRVGVWEEHYHAD